MIDKLSLSDKARAIRRKLGEGDSLPIDIFKAVNKIEKLTLIFYPLGKNISGVCYKLNKSSAIVINSEMSVGRQRFSLAHELYHFYYDGDDVNSISAQLIGGGDENEKKADQFASYFLVPTLSLQEMVESILEENNKDSLSIDDIIEIEQYYGTSHKAMIYRLLNEGYITQEEKIPEGIIERAAQLGYDTSLYKPSSKKITLGYYVDSLGKLLNRDIISQGKYDELLLDACREDIVYGLDDEEDIRID